MAEAVHELRHNRASFSEPEGIGRDKFDEWVSVLAHDHLKTVKAGGCLASARACRGLGQEVVPKRLLLKSFHLLALRGMLIERFDCLHGSLSQMGRVSGTFG